MIRKAFKRIAMPANHGEGIVDLGPLLWMFSQERVDLGLRQILRIESATRRHGLGADKWLFFIHQIEARAVDTQIAP